MLGEHHFLGVEALSKRHSVTSPWQKATLSNNWLRARREKLLATMAAAIPAIRRAAPTSRDTS